MASSSHPTFASRRILVTGGTTGIGLATATQLRDAGARVVVTGRNPETLASARAALGDSVEVVASDAGRLDDIERLVQHVHATLGGLDGVFLNAGVARFAPLSDTDEDLFDRLFTVNVKGPYFALRAALPLLVDGAAVVFNTSIVNQKGMHGTTAYAATKAALRSLVRTAAAELAPRNIRVNAISPGPIETPIYGKLGLSAAAAEGFAHSVRERVPLARFGQPDEVARAVLFLLGDGASYVTGSELAVDGGLAQV